MKATLNSKSFAAGEIRPDLFGRTDSNKYQTGLKKARGVFINKCGALLNCPGTETIIPGKYPTKATRSIPFKFSFNQQYDLIFGDEYLHIVNNGEPVFAFDSVVSDFPNATNPTLTIGVGSSQANIVNVFKNGLLIQLKPSGNIAPTTDIPFQTSDLSKFCYNRWFIVQNITMGLYSTTFTLTNLDGSQIDSSTWGTYQANLTLWAIYELATPYADTDLSLLNFFQSFDILQIRHHLYQRMQLKRAVGNVTTSWTLEPNYSWPSQLGMVNDLGAAGGVTGNTNYYYKVSTYDLSTKQESLPCPIANWATAYSQISTKMEYYSNSPTNGTATLLVYLPTVVGLVVGQMIQFSKDIYGVHAISIEAKDHLIYAGTDYSIKSIDVVNNIIGVYVFNNTRIVSADPQIATCTTKLALGPNNITVLTNTNPINITTKTAHGLTNGQEIQILGTNIFGLDTLNFNVTIVNTTTFSLNGVDASNYDMTTLALGDGSIISATAIATTNKTPSIVSPISVTGIVTSTTVYTSNIIFLIYASDALNNGYGFIGSVLPAIGNTNFVFKDQGIPPDTTRPPKSYIPLFMGAGNYPSAGNFYQQRIVELATDNHPQGLYASVVGDYHDFTQRFPIQPNDAILMDVWSNELRQIFNSVDSGFLVLITDTGPMVAAGDSSGEFTPGTNLIKRYAFAGGAQQPRPLHIFKNIVYLEANQGAMRDLEVLVTPFYTYIDKSEDVSLFSEHLLTASPLIAWDYKLYPDSQIISVRTDGIALLTTYFQEQQLQAFSWMDTNNGVDKFLDVVCIQEGVETYAYFAVQRQSGPWIERMASRYYSDETYDAIFTHATASYDGKVNNGSTVVLSGGTTVGATLTATSITGSPVFFQVGWQMNFKVQAPISDSNGNPIFYNARMIVTYRDNYIVQGTLIEAIPTAMLGMTISDIRIASNILAGLGHLEGQTVSVVADGWVQADANNGTGIVVVNGQITLPESFGVIHAGLPYNSDVQTLDIDEHQGETFMDKKIGVPRVTMKLLNTGDISVGPNFTEYLPANVKMDHPKLREGEGYLTPTNLFTGIIQVPIDTRYGFGGSFALRNSAPLPMAILSLAPLVEVQK